MAGSLGTWAGLIPPQLEFPYLSAQYSYKGIITLVPEDKPGNTLLVMITTVRLCELN